MKQYIVVACINKTRVHVRPGVSAANVIMQRHHSAYGRTIALIPVENAYACIGAITRHLTERGVTRRHGYNTVTHARSHAAVLIDVLDVLEADADCAIIWGHGTR